MCYSKLSVGLPEPHPKSELDWQPGSSILAGGSVSVWVSVGGAFRCLDLDLHPLDLGSNLQELSLPPQVF